MALILPPVQIGPPAEPDPRFRLDPSCFPRSLALALPDELLVRLERQAQRCNRSLPELIELLLAAQLHG